MSEKPSLYVVEKKEVIILVVLFVLVTVLSFTLGVRYGESVGRKMSHEQETANREQGGEGADAGGGTLGKAEAPHKDEAGSLEKGDEKKETKAEEHKAEGKAEEHKEAKAEEKKEGGTPEAAAKSAAASGANHEAVDKSSDEYLLNALKESGVEPPGGKAPQNAKLPESMKETAAPKAASKAKSGTFVIQVGSHPTVSEAESQLHALTAHAGSKREA